MYAYETLVGEHMALARDASALVAAIDGAEPAEALAVRIACFADALARHLAVEDGEIYPRLVASRDAGDALAARDAIDRFATLAGDVAAYRAHWTTAAIAADRPAFAAATAMLVESVRSRMRSEDQLLYPMALRGAHIRLRA